MHVLASVHILFFLRGVSHVMVGMENIFLIEFPIPSHFHRNSVAVNMSFCWGFFSDKKGVGMVQGRWAVNSGE